MFFNNFTNLPSDVGRVMHFYNFPAEIFISCGSKSPSRRHLFLNHSICWEVFCVSKLFSSPLGSRGSLTKRALRRVFSGQGNCSNIQQHIRALEFFKKYSRYNEFFQKVLAVKSIRGLKLLSLFQVFAVFFSM